MDGGLQRRGAGVGTTPVTLLHRELCVHDIDAAARFYESALGFHPVASGGYSAGPWLEATTGLAGARLRTRLLRNAQGVALQLVQFASPAPIGVRTRRPMNLLGQTHINFYVRDLEQTLADIHANGGAVHERTRLDAPLEDGTASTMIYCTDPDGVRLEVWTTAPYGAGNSMAIAVPGVARKFSHSGICVRDVERSLAFYACLGQQKGETFDYRDFPGGLDRVLELRGARLLAQMTRNSRGDVIELLAYADAPPQGLGVPPPANQYGLARLAFRTGDVQATTRALVAAGGRALGEACTWPDGSKRLRCADPDGVAIELVQEAQSQ